MRMQWWFDILDGLPETLVKDGFMSVSDWERPGLGLTFNAKAREYLRAGDEDFFDPVLPELANAVKPKHGQGSSGSKL
eukprot:COSAG06_NODE_10366_length_1694_cov_2.430721_2_plen_78_part_00